MTSLPLRRRRPTLRGLRARSGFSILELTVTLILIGIIMAVAGTRVSAVMTQQRVTRAANMIQTDLETAFTLAARNRAPMAIQYTPATMVFTVANRTASTVYKRTNFKDSRFGFRSGEVTASSNAIEVYPNGFASDTISILISATRGGKTYQKRVRMSRAGLVKVI